MAAAIVSIVLAENDEGGAMKKIGLVKWFNTQKGFGFIKPVDGGFDVYVHIKTVQQAGWVELKEGQKVCFDSIVDERTGEIIAENLSVPPHTIPQEGQRLLIGGVVARSE
jgi:CspA family cold shock protein